MTTRMDLKVWFDQGKKEGATHMIVVCDTFDFGDYPAYVGKDENVHDRITYYKYNQFMTKSQPSIITFCNPCKYNELGCSYNFHSDEHHCACLNV